MSASLARAGLTSCVRLPKEDIVPYVRQPELLVPLLIPMIYIKEHPELFKIKRFEVLISNPFPHLRLTVDTDEDFELASLVYEALYKGKPFPIKDTIRFFSDHPDLVSINSSVVQRPMTHSERRNP